VQDNWKNLKPIKTKMRKYLIICFLFKLLLFITPTNINAQSGLELGIKAGLNIANLNGGPHELATRAGLFAGLAIGYSAESLPVEFESGLFYSQKGAEGRYKESIIKGSYEGNAGTFKLDYLEIPLLAKYRFDTEAAVSPYILAGPYLDISLNSEVKASKNIAYIEDISAEIKRIGFGLLIGAGGDFKISGRKLNVQARYSLGLSPVYENRSDEGEKHGVFTVAAGFTF